MFEFHLIVIHMNMSSCQLSGWEFGVTGVHDAQGHVLESAARHKKPSVLPIKQMYLLLLHRYCETGHDRRCSVRQHAQLSPERDGGGGDSSIWFVPTSYRVQVLQL